MWFPTAFPGFESAFYLAKKYILQGMDHFMDATVHLSKVSISLDHNSFDNDQLLVYIKTNKKSFSEQTIQGLMSLTSFFAQTSNKSEMFGKYVTLEFNNCNLK